MVPSGNVVFIDLQPSRTRRYVKRIRHEKRLSRNKSQSTPIVSQCSVEPKIHEPKTGYTLRQLWTYSEPAIGRKSSLSSDVKDSDIHRAVAALVDLLSSRCLTVSSFSCWGRQQPKMSHHKLAPWYKEPWRNGNTPYAKTRQLRSLNRCKSADQPSSKKMAAKCLLALSLTGHSRTPRH